MEIFKLILNVKMYIPMHIPVDMYYMYYGLIFRTFLKDVTIYLIL